MGFGSAHPYSLKHPGPVCQRLVFWTVGAGATRGTHPATPSATTTATLLNFTPPTFYPSARKVKGPLDK